MGSVLAIAASTAGAAGVRVIDQQRIEPRVVELTISTPAFTEPTKVQVDLPAGYDSHPKRRWPVTYVLAGIMNTYKSFNSMVGGVELTKGYPAIVVSPNGDSGFWSDWYNGGALGPPMYETYVADQLIPLIDRRFRTDRGRSHRTVMGVSMGGYGAMMIAARHPDLFAAAASLSGAVDSNLPTIGTALSLSPTFQGAEPDAIYGPRASEEVRWRGHNPGDLAGNLRGLDLQVRSANGVINPGIGEDPASPDTVSCVIEGGVYMASVSLHQRLDALAMPHLWRDYGAGCHSVPNFKREIVDTLERFERVLADPPAMPRRFTYDSIEPAFGVYGWRVRADPRRALEFMRLRGARRHGMTIAGSGLTKVTTPPLFRRARRVTLEGAVEHRATPGRKGRIRFTVDLGPPDRGQEYRPGVETKRVTRTVTFQPR
jgi:S-formylglutathione hydrolase FrmB